MSLISKDYITSSELAGLKGVQLKTVYNWVKNNAAPPYIRERGVYWFHKSTAINFEKPTRGRRSKP